MAAAAPYAAVAGSVLSAGAAIVGGKQSKNDAYGNAELDYQNARVIRDKTEGDIRDLRREHTRQLGAIRAAAGEGGVDVSEGSALEALTLAAGQGELNVLRRRWTGELGARNYLVDAEIQKQKGERAEMAGYVQAGASLLGGASKAASLLGGGGGGGGGETGITASSPAAAQAAYGSSAASFTRPGF